VTDFLKALKDDLLDRRMLPLVALVAAALLGAFAYVQFGGSGETAHTAALAHPAPTGLRSGVTISQFTSANPLAETTSGGTEQHQGHTRDPFVSPSGGLAPSTTTSAASGSNAGSGSSTGTSTPSSSSGQSGSSGSGGGEGGPTKGSKPSSGSTAYDVAVLFGETATGSSTALVLRQRLKLMTPLPSSAEPIVVYRGVKKGGKSATFTVSGEAILHGAGICAPSEAQCETISLKVGQSEQLEYLPANAQSPVTYELRVASIAAVEATAATVASLWKGQSVAGLEILRSGDLLSLPGLRESAVAGVLLPAP